MGDVKKTLLKRKSGNVCCFNGCKNKSYNSNEKFYTFPKDPERAKVWLEACYRPDLLNKLETLYKSSYRLCGSHFENDMVIGNHKRKLLRQNAVPTKFITTSKSSTDIGTSGKDEISSLDLAIPSTSTSSPKCSTSYVQTPATLSSHTPRKEMLRNTSKVLQDENIVLKRQNEKLCKENEELRRKLADTPNLISLDQLQELIIKSCPSRETADFLNILWHGILFSYTNAAADDDYNILHKDGSFEFGYTNPDSYHFADGNRNNVVRGEFGGRSPKTGAIDTTVYTAGPRGFRPRGKNVYRKYDLNQNGPRAVGSRDDPYYDPYEDPSYNFAFKTRTYSRQESANRVGDVSGRFTYLDDVGERHNVEFIAGRNTGFHVKTPFPDSNPRAYGPLYFRGRGRPIPRGRTSIQRGLDGSYKFVSAGPDQRRTEVSDSTGHVRGSYTYLDDKGVQHSVHYIAGPETGYRVLKTVKGAHLPTVFPFEKPDIIPPDFYDYGSAGDVFDTAANGRPFKPGGKPSRPSSDLGNGIDVGKDDYDRFGGDKQYGGDTEDDSGDNDFGNKKPSSGTRPGSTFGSTPPSRPSGRPGGRPGARPGGASETTDTGGDIGFDSGGDEASPDFGDLFGGGEGGSTTARPGFRPTTRRPSSRPTGRPTVTTFKPSSQPGLSLGDGDDGSYKPEGDDGSYRPGGDGSSTGFGAGGSPTTAKPGGSTTAFPGYPSGRPTTGSGSLGFEDEYDVNDVPDKGLFGSDSGRPFGGGNGGTGTYEGDSESGGGTLQVGGGKRPCPKCTGTIVTNIGYKPFHVPPGVSVRAHVQSIDLYPYDDSSLSEALKTDTALKREQLNEASTDTPISTKETETQASDNTVKTTAIASVQTTTDKSD